MNKEKKIYLLPIFLILAIVPIIVFYKDIPLEGILYGAWPVNERNSDFFSYYKMRTLLALTLLSSISFIYYIYKEKEIKNYIYNIPLVGYMILIFFSSILSNYKPVSLNGVADRYEGMYVLLAYVLLAIIVNIMVKNEFDIKIILAGLFISTTIITIIGIFQYFGEVKEVNLDFFRSDFGKELILPKSLKHFAKNLEFRFGKHTIYSTLYNTNYVGSFILMPLFICLSLVLTHIKNWRYKLMGILFLFLVFSNFIGCRSRAGFVGGIVALIVFFVIYLSNKMVNEYKNDRKLKNFIMKNIDIIIIFLGFFLIAFSLNMYSEKSLFKQITKLKKDILITTDSEKELKIEKKVIIKKIDFKSEKIDLYLTNNEKLVIKYDLDTEQIIFENKNGDVLKTNKYNSGEIEIVNENLKEISLKFRKIQVKNDIYKLLEINIEDYKFEIFLTNDGFRLYNSSDNELYLPQKIESVKILDGKERVGSSRGYIYGRSIPLLRKTLLLGYGADTYSIVFPQEDSLGKILAYKTEHKVIDKPHNLYLQIGINTGVLSLLINLFIYIYYFITSIILYIKIKEYDLCYAVGLGSFVGITGYLIAGIFNDSIISVAPVFWIILGLGIAINNIIKNKTAS
ncbi:MAG: hypothetical protein GX287_06835 [Fusobacteria bacterium]|nr:hypothetical protein [Fusobacteriota bacterium]